MELHVVFGTGAAGAATARALVGMGKQVRVVNRSGKSNELLPSNVEVVAADASDVESTRSAAEGASVIYQCLNAPYHLWKEVFPVLQNGVLQAANDTGAKLVTLENVYMYGDTNGTPMTEDLPYAARTEKGQVRAAMSRQLTEAHERGDVQVVIGRASDYYGPAVVSSMGERTFAPLVKGKPAEVAGDPDLPHTYAYSDDVGYGLAILGTHDNAIGEIWHLPSAPAMTQREMLEIAAKYAGVSLKINSVNRTTLRLVGIFMPGARAMVEMMYEFEKPFVVDSSKFFKAFGEHYTPIEEGIHCTVDWYKDQE